MSPRLKLSLRIAASVVMLALLLIGAPEIRWTELVPDPSTTTMAWLGGAAALTLVGAALSAVRWSQVLTAMDVRARPGRLLSHTLAGQFVSSVMPTTIGGDVIRVARLARETGQGPSSFASVVLERLTGWIVLPVITLLGFALNPGLRGLGLATTVAVSLAAATLVGLAVVLVIAANERFEDRPDDRRRWRRFVSAIHYGVAKISARPAAAVRVLAAGFAYQLVLVLAAVAAAQALGVDAAGLTALLAFFPAVLMAQVAPVSISGLGVREGAFVLFLTPLGVPADKAIALGLLLYLLNAGVGLLGAPAFALGDRDDRRAVAAA